MALAAQCRYTNCRHTSEQGCAVTAALAEGTLDVRHYAGFVKMKRELSDLAVRSTEKIRQSKQRATRYRKNKLNDADDARGEYL